MRGPRYASSQTRKTNRVNHTEVSLTTHPGSTTSLVLSPAVHTIAAATATGFVAARWLTFLNRWELLPVSFNDTLLTVAQVVAVPVALVVVDDFSFTALVVSVALADIATAVAVLVDRMITAATVWPSLPRRR